MLDSIAKQIELLEDVCERKLYEDALTRIVDLDNEFRVVCSSDELSGDDKNFLANLIARFDKLVSKLLEERQQLAQELITLNRNKLKVNQYKQFK